MEEQLQVFIDAAEQLEELKRTLSQQQSYTTRLGGLTESIGRATAQIAKVPEVLGVMLKGAETVEQRVGAVAVRVEELKNQIPAVIERIEKSDVGRSINILVTEISSSRADLRDFRAAIAEVENISDSVRLANDAMLKSVSAEIESIRIGQEGMNKAIADMQAEFVSKFDVLGATVVKSAAVYQEGGAATARALDGVVGLVKSTADHHLALLKRLKADIDELGRQEVAAIRNEIAVISNQIQRQGTAIETLAKKKGFSF